MKNIILIIAAALALGAGSVVVIHHFQKTPDQKTEAEYVKKSLENTEAGRNFTY
jgi:flagellar basal body-associated protein FliL